MENHFHSHNPHFLGASQFPSFRFASYRYLILLVYSALTSLRDLISLRNDFPTKIISLCSAALDPTPRLGERMHTETPRHTKTQIHTATTLKVYGKIVNKKGLCLNWSAFDHELTLSRQVWSEQLRCSMLTDFAERSSRLSFTFHPRFLSSRRCERALLANLEQPPPPNHPDSRWIERNRI